MGTVRVEEEVTDILKACVKTANRFRRGALAEARCASSLGRKRYLSQFILVSQKCPDLFKPFLLINIT